MEIVKSDFIKGIYLLNCIAKDGDSETIKMIVE